MVVLTKYVGTIMRISNGVIEYQIKSILLLFTDYLGDVLQENTLERQNTNF